MSPCQKDTGLPDALFEALAGADVPYVVDLTLEHCMADAKSRGLSVRMPSTYELFVDIDSAADHDLFWRSYVKLQEFGVVADGQLPVVTPSKSGLPKRHAVVTVKEALTAERRILLQALLGSDRMRELLSFARMEAGNQEPTLFFEAP